MDVSEFLDSCLLTRVLDRGGNLKIRDHRQVLRELCDAAGKPGCGPVGGLVLALVQYPAGLGMRGVGLLIFEMGAFYSGETKIGKVEFFYRL